MFRPDLTEQEKNNLREILFESYCENNELCPESEPLSGGTFVHGSRGGHGTGLL